MAQTTIKWRFGTECNIWVCLCSNLNIRYFNTECEEGEHYSSKLNNIYIYLFLLSSTSLICLYVENDKLWSAPISPL